VANISRQLAHRLGLRGNRVVNLWRGAVMHDIGKLGVSGEIVFKKGPLTDEEWVEMRKHPDYSYEILKRIPFFEDALIIPNYHHEKWDGSGYPCRLKGEEIPLEARIFSVVDVWDSLLSDRPYRNAWERERVIEYIRHNLGSFFDPVVGEEFLHMVEEENLGKATR
jgi:HD-GYP domain-containing protein (c-di-GMP phosphodiesterase class II)